MITLNEFIRDCLFIEPEIDGATLFESVESLACAFKAATGETHCDPLRFALHIRSLIPTIRVEEVAPEEVIVFGACLTPAARSLGPTS
jgi:hypothetical protein